MIEAIPVEVSVTPAPPLALRLPGVAMKPTIDIVQVVAPQILQNAKLKFMLTGIFEEIPPVSFEIAPGNDLPVLALALRCIEVAAEQPGPMRWRSESLKDASQQIQLEVRIELPTSTGILFEMIGGSDIDIC